MLVTKPSLPKGTRDFSPPEMVKRNYIFDVIKAVFKKYGYAEIQTPGMENLQTLTGKYGDEGDRLIFKILNSGDYLAKADKQLLQSLNLQQVTSKISEKALRYDLTVPFARYVAMRQNDIVFPFKRFQIQPVWRADRPQKGRYREFYQCDADVVGSSSLLNEAEFVLIYKEALNNLGLKDFTIKINNRKILSGIAQMIGKPNLIVEMTAAIDKIDKIGLEGIIKELLTRGFTQSDIETLKPIILLEGNNQTKLERLKAVLATSKLGLKGIEEIEKVFDYLRNFSVPISNIEMDITLARGLNYYTGCIFEVKTNEVVMGSIGGGGRYDGLADMFGLKDLTGAGISFGADRIYDVLEELNLFPTSALFGPKVLICNFDEKAETYALPLLQKLRQANIAAELYPSWAKLKKQMSYADNKKIPYVILIGDEEIADNLITLKNLQSGKQQKLSVDQVISLLGS